MPHLTRRVPRLCKHSSGQGFLTIEGRQVYLGPFDDPATKERYDRLIAEWLANGRRLPLEITSPNPTGITILQLVDAYRPWVKARYASSEAGVIAIAMRVVRELYGATQALDFGPNRLRAVRAVMIGKGWGRRSINRQVSRVRGLLKWAVAHELLPAGAYERLRALEPLRRGEATERPGVTTVPREYIRRIRRHLPAPVRALISLQELSGARAAELLGLRAIDLDTTGEVWSWELADHKTAHLGKRRVLYFGPRAQRILGLCMRRWRPVDAPLFSPREAEAARHERATTHRRSGQKPNPRATDRKLGDRYTTASYRRAIHRACDKAGVPRWGPHRLRHNAATAVRREFGLELARLVLGHADISTTQLYAEADDKKLKEVAKRLG